MATRLLYWCRESVTFRLTQALLKRGFPAANGGRRRQPWRPIPHRYTARFGRPFFAPLAKAFATDPFLRLLHRSKLR